MGRWMPEWTGQGWNNASSLSKVLSVRATSPGTVNFVTEGCTEADVRLIKWDKYTILAIVFTGCVEVCRRVRGTTHCGMRIFRESNGTGVASGGLEGTCPEGVGVTIGNR